MENKRYMEFKYVAEFSYYTQFIFSVLTLGCYFIVTKIFRNMRLLLKFYKCTERDATHVIITCNDKRYAYKIEKVKVTKRYELLRNFINYFLEVRILDTEYGRFVFDYKNNQFMYLNFSYNVLSRMCEEEKRIAYGDNTIETEILLYYDIVCMKFFKLEIFWEISTATVCLIINYWKYFVVVASIYTVLLFKSIFEEIKENNNRRRVANKERNVKIYKKFDSGFKLINSMFLYPGDIILVNPTKNFKCDAKIISGNVITNEAFLTGESIPICKGEGEEIFSGTEILRSCNDEDKHERDTNFYTKLKRVKNLFTNSSKVVKYKPKQLQFKYTENVNNYAVAKVTATGRRTKNGQLIKNVFLRNNVKNELKICFQNISIVILLTCIAVVAGYVYYLQNYLHLIKALLCGLDILGNSFSPTLIVCAEFNVLKAISRLKKFNVHTNDKDRIVEAGNVDTIVFDKTGTLTEIGLEIKEVDTITEKIEDSKYFESDTKKVTKLIRMGMSTCHQVVEINGEYSGDVLDMKMFLFSNCEIFTLEKIKHVRYKTQEKMEEKKIVKEFSSDKSEKKEEIEFVLFNEKQKHINCFNLNPTTKILKIFEFNSIDKRMSVIVEHDRKFFVFYKGAPEILKKSMKDIDDLYDINYKKHSITGYRTLTLCYKDITELVKTKSIDQILREECESELQFLSFLVFANNLKKETKDVIKQLNNSDIKTRMCTGDSVLTAISVGKESGMIHKDMPILFPVISEENTNETTETSFFDSENLSVQYDWVCVANDEYVFDKHKLELYLEYDDAHEIDYVVAIEGREYYEMIKDSKYKEMILKKVVIFARFTPDGKKHLVGQFIGHKDNTEKIEKTKSNTDTNTVMFCGDGANDAGALCAATVSVLLTTDSTTRISSFTAQRLFSVVEIIKEGKNALVLGMSQFKYNFYSLILSGLVMCVTLVSHNFPSDGMSLITDLISCYGLGNVLLLTAYEKMNKKKIRINVYKHCGLLAVELLFILIVYFITALVFVPANECLMSFKELKKFNLPTDENSMVEISNQASILFYLTMFVYINKVMYFALSISGRKLWKNYKFMGVMVVIVGMFVVLLLDNIFEWNWMYEGLDFSELTRKEVCVMLVDFVILGLIVNVFSYGVKNIEYY